MSESLRVWVEFDTGRDPIGGRLSCRDSERAFTGWLGLIAALESAIAERKDRGDDAGEGPPGAGDPRPSAANFS